MAQSDEDAEYWRKFKADLSNIPKKKRKKKTIDLSLMGLISSNKKTRYW